ncbi:LacI family DNA-binding transcriptional regulator [Petrotoga sp. 9PWA.NaAc.5.4]|uniref:LacI family DNA-binding transcriptional regulator n=1 Tax=Petrotoga sp. 9PWA.NaAc.5.4 TaxID=1434328 RepID=UPI000CA90174|nr:LacI family DNA-binding transcriptional regulator [Petrotoga sp. 9PWA.NaAc.5.4]PNR96996.1 LacI family transcriptional regulator [Petrotoga sp. 9PWA.NaAc.5.4]
MKMTIKEVAKYANVSVGTVSRVINGEKNVSKENFQKVLRAIEKLGYVRNTLPEVLFLREKILFLL